LEKPGLYVHVPFCREKCPYCGFFSVAHLSPLARWMAALPREAGFFRGAFDAFDSLYMGGGTPSILGIEEIGALSAELRRRFTITGDAEITLEANPQDLTPEKARGLRALGFNRLILGVQSLDDDVLRFLGRTHNASEARAALDHAREAGFPVVGVDLMYALGVPELDRRWERTLRSVLEYEPEHLSCYTLTIEPRTEFEARTRKGTISRIPESGARRLFLETTAFLQSHGYHHYEVSNFARGPVFEARHNRKYWRRTPYLGLGPAAHSSLGNKRWWNPPSIRRYCTAIEGGRSPAEGGETLTEEQIALEKAALGLRMREGFRLDPDMSRRIPADRLLRLEDEGLIEVRGARVRPTLEGMLVADHLPLELFP